jgi:sterol O-acyltransferase
MLLKQHSWTASNIELTYKNLRLNELINSSKKHDSAQNHNDEIQHLKSELNHEKVTFPNNITFYNFTDYILIPTLVYEMEYPRTNRFRLLIIQV